MGSTAHHCCRWFLKRRPLEAWHASHLPAGVDTGTLHPKASSSSPAPVESLDRPCAAEDATSTISSLRGRQRWP
ncbi:hypothetical protein HBI56_064280 [Parastagonospora nodorum]|nr:hypothetical protein HBI09_080520 [Parastagonospora nodorum]KAH4218029.1 hypothetical protein HBI06_206180 [Parastagonospora nodorum]KAH4243040.1 hypothetical protein HBI05_092720 [Parastagonospora nodorum]KAH4924747.1 hypothetical protein HBI79_160840 [Parastagonospora nodorum]KAH4988183.1 hypothetical protein HBI76_087880 [Parastagonospora nodorum]